MKRKYCIRLSEEIQKEVDEFAITQGMKPTTAVEFFVKLGIQSLKKSEQDTARLDDLEAGITSKLSLMHEALARTVLYTAMKEPTNAEVLAKANETALSSKKKIFG